MINVNKLFPRLSIRVKLAVAFALVALVPLAVVSVLGARETIFQIESKARNTLEHDLQMAEAQTAQSMSSAEGHVGLMAQVILGPLLRNPMVPGSEFAAAAPVVQALLVSEKSLHQVKLIDEAGSYRMIVGRTGAVRDVAQLEGGEYYAWRASTMKRDTRLLFAIELRGPDSTRLQAMPAVAILVPLFGDQGQFQGAVVGEAYASALFSHVDFATPGFEGVTGLVDAEGHFLYHSVRKRDWSTLLAYRDQISVRSDFPSEVATAILSGQSGTVVTPAQELVSYRPLSLGNASEAELTSYRVVPVAKLEAPTRQFLLAVLLSALFVALLVIGLAVVAADQLTKPIFQIRDAAWQLARDEPVRPLDVSTNDEIEDLARDFALVAEQVALQRTQREELIAERTRVLEQTHAELTDILERSADGIIGLDLDQVVRVWNHGAERLIGHASDEAIGRHIDEVLRPRDERARRARVALRTELARDGAVVNLLTEVLAKDGTPIQVSLTETLISAADGRPLGASLIVRDNRLQSRLEDQMRRSERLAAISVMAAGLAHEINNPLAIIGNRIEVMQRDIMDRWHDTSLATDIAVLQQHVARLRELTTSLLRFARDDGREAGPIALVALADRTVALLRRSLATRRLKLLHDVEAAMPPVVGYEKMIETVIVNLLLNAADATPPDGTVTLRIHRSAGGDAAEIEVIDTGPGISPDLWERIFDPFFTTKPAGHGTGLGLTVCRSIVDRHGGSIRVESSPEGGCRFVVTLPLQPVGAIWEAFASS